MTQLTFSKDPVVKQRTIAKHGKLTYLVHKTSFGWHAQFNDPDYGNGLTFHHIAALVYDGQKEAEVACSVHASMAVK